MATTRSRPGHRGNPGALVASAVFIALVGAAALAGRLSWFVPGLYLGMSIVTFIVYAADKSAARGDRWRTAESTLHLLALGGGWPGALLAQQRLRHKSKKEAFLAVFRLTVAANCGALAWLLWIGAA